MTATDAHTTGADRRRAAPRVTLLSAMLDADIARSLDRHVSLGLRDLDLKDGIFGRSILDLDDAQARELKQMADDRGLRVHCLSTGLFDDWIEHGEAHFREHHTRRVNRAAELAHALQPRFVRLLAARTRTRTPGQPLLDHLDQAAPWLLDLYRDAIDRLHSQGLAVTIENEARGCILTHAGDILAFFRDLPVGERLGFTWDIQNLWENGAFPSLSIYRDIQPLVNYVHVKGGIAGEDGRLRYRSALREASWPVREILRAVAADGVSPVVCVNPSHGESPEGFDARAVAEDDVRFLQALFSEEA